MFRPQMPGTAPVPTAHMPTTPTVHVPASPVQGHHAPAPCSCTASHASAPAAVRTVTPFATRVAGVVVAVLVVGVVLTALLATVAITAVSVSIAAVVLRSLLNSATKR
ncbi:SpdD protein [Streptomyces longispororuber]|nr:SpdD protein [Streptomyces longispororuber]MCQ4207823.1 SpdD protein [Streptomyces longispororuber]